MGRAITTDRYRYIEWNGGDQGRELYDHQTDPHEHTNLATDPAHTQNIHHLRSLFPPSVSAHPPTTPINPKRL
jgi:uncharacterized sulfatase